VLFIPVVKDIEADELAVCDEIKVIPSPSCYVVCCCSSYCSHYVNLKYLIDISAELAGAVAKVKVVPDIV